MQTAGNVVPSLRSSAVSLCRPQVPESGAPLALHDSLLIDAACSLWPPKTQLWTPYAGASAADRPNRLTLFPRGHSMNRFRLGFILLLSVGTSVAVLPILPTYAQQRGFQQPAGTSQTES